jgi:hypothetical protein
MVGKSAHGNGGKIPYYEHGWATRRESCLVKPVYSCKPFRVLAKKLEPAVWEAVHNLLKNEFLVKDLIKNAETLHKEKSQNKEAKRIESKIKSIESQIEVLAERLAMLPKSVSPATIFRQLEKLEASKRDEENRLAGLGLTHTRSEMPATLTQYQEFLKGLAHLADHLTDPVIKEKIIRALVQRIWITEEGFKLEFITGGEYIEMQSRVLEPDLEIPDLRQENDPSPPRDFRQKKSRNQFLVPGSNSLTNGGPTRTRTWDQAVLQKNRERQA